VDRAGAVLEDLFSFVRALPPDKIKSRGNLTISSTIAYVPATSVINPMRKVSKLIAARAMFLGVNQLPSRRSNTHIRGGK
jgi:hypothetical protein